jgi:hypothetical protein
MVVEVRVDIPCDPTQIDETDLPWAFMDDMAHPEGLVEGAIVVTGDAEDPLFAATDRRISTRRRLASCGHQGRAVLDGQEAPSPPTNVRTAHQSRERQ